MSLNISNISYNIKIIVLFNTYLKRLLELYSYKLTILSLFKIKKLME